MAATLFPQHDSLHLVTPSAFAARTAALKARADSLSTGDLAELQVVSDLLESVLALKRDVVSHHASPKARAYEAHQAACKAEHDELNPVLALERRIKSVIAALETKRRKEQEEAEQAARHTAEQASAELQEQLIETAERSGASPAEIAALCHMPVSVPVAQPARWIEQPKGFSASDQFQVEVTDFKALAHAVLEGKAPIQVLQPNLKVLTAMAKALKGNLQLPGVSITRNLSVSGRKSR
jgi:hypothetical protein